MKRLHLLISGLAAAEHPPRLRTLLARGEAEPAPGDASLSETLAGLFGLEGTPLAPLTLAAEGMDPGDALWLRADPVHLSAGLHHLTLLDHNSFRLGRDEADAIVTALNAHFAGELAFLAPDPLRWYARPRSPLRASAPPLDRVAGGVIVPGMFDGPDAAKLQGLATEAQMLLHMHPVNEAREARGELPVNGLWFWGGGHYAKPATSLGKVLADDFSAIALGRAAGLPHRSSPARFDPADLDAEATLAVLEGANAATLDAAWFGPLLTALQRGRLDQLAIDCCGPDAISTRLDRRSAWRIWRR